MKDKNNEIVGLNPKNDRPSNTDIKYDTKFKANKINTDNTLGNSQLKEYKDKNNKIIDELNFKEMNIHKNSKKMT